MKKIRGIVSNINNTTKVSGSGNDSAVISTQVAVFRINDQIIRVVAGPLEINDGDDMVVVGIVQDNKLYSYAYKNFTNRLSGEASSGVYTIMGAICGVMGATIIAESLFSREICSIPIALFGLVLIALAFKPFSKANQISQAICHFSPAFPHLVFTTIPSGTAL